MIFGMYISYIVRMQCKHGKVTRARIAHGVFKSKQGLHSYDTRVDKHVLNTRSVIHVLLIN
jgi:hypothetical protein